jgi:hypothetical protein
MCGGEQAGLRHGRHRGPNHHKSLSRRVRQRLDEAASIAKAAQACAESGNTKQGIAIALDVEHWSTRVNTLLNAASLINRISKD